MADRLQRHSGHKLYAEKDFNQAERDSRNALYVVVVEGGLDVCKQCGAAESELDDFPACRYYDAHRREIRQEQRQWPT